MFSIIFTCFYYKLVHKASSVTVNGFIVIVPVLADCFIATQVLSFLSV